MYSLEARVVHTLADFGLNIVDGVPEGLGYGLAPQTLHVEIVGFGGKDEEHNHGFVRSRLLEGMLILLLSPLFYHYSCGIPLSNSEIL